MGAANRETDDATRWRVTEWDAIPGLIHGFLGRAHRWVARLSLVTIVGLAMLGWKGWAMWAVLVVVIGLDHPPTLDDRPLDPRRRIAAWLTIALFFATFMAVPIQVIGAD